MKSLILKVTSIRKLTTLVGDMLCALLYITGYKTRNIDLSKVSVILKYH